MSRAHPVVTAADGLTREVIREKFEAEVSGVRRSVPQTGLRLIVDGGVPCFAGHPLRAQSVLECAEATSRMHERPVGKVASSYFQ